MKSDRKAKRYKIGFLKILFNGMIDKPKEHR